MTEADGSSEFPRLDHQLAAWSDRLVRELRVPRECSKTLASSTAREVAALDRQERLLIREASPVSVRDRLDELVAFQAFMDSVPPAAPPPLVRAQVIVQNYICFVYLGESCFRELRKIVSSGSAAHRCCRFLTDNPVRAFRNALAHANWRYKDDFTGLEFWAREGASRDEPMVRWEVSHNDMMFWQAVARCTAYASYLSL